MHLDTDIIVEKVFIDHRPLLFIPCHFADFQSVKIVVRVLIRVKDDVVFPVKGIGAVASPPGPVLKRK
jgi:hypothetical protein